MGLEGSRGGGQTDRDLPTRLIVCVIGLGRQSGEKSRLGRGLLPGRGREVLTVEGAREWTSDPYGDAKGGRPYGPKGQRVTESGTVWGWG